MQGGVCLSDGFYSDAISAGLKSDNAKDMAFIYIDTECEIASIFTTNKMYAAPIKHFRNKGNFKTNFIRGTAMLEWCGGSLRIKILI